MLKYKKYILHNNKDRSIQYVRVLKVHKATVLVFLQYEEVPQKRAWYHWSGSILYKLIHKIIDLQIDAAFR